MYGKLFSSLYTGSMIGTGAVPFALMPYIIATARPDKNLGGYVELNPVLLAAIFGVTEADIQRGIDFLCKPDPKSRTPDEDGRRLVKLGPFDYRVVNYAKYRAIRDEEERREQNRVAQEKFRKKQKELEGMTPAQRVVYLKAKAKGRLAVTKQIQHNGEVAGRTEKVAEALEEAKPEWGSRPTIK